MREAGGEEVVFAWFWAVRSQKKQRQGRKITQQMHGKHNLQAQKGKGEEKEGREGGAS
jgi:hypothetical protein